MNCETVSKLQDAYGDNELDAANAREVSEHLAICSSCALTHADHMSFKQIITRHTTRAEIPPALHSRVRQLIAVSDAGDTPLVNAYRTTPAGSSIFHALKWGGAGALLATAACFTLFILMQPDVGYLTEQQLFSSHIRSLQDGHLTDVLSTDKHTVKPWFNGRLDLSPPVVDLAAQGFPLIGGRLDYVDHHNVAAIVFRHNAHVINVFVWPADRNLSGAFSAAMQPTVKQQGYTLRYWQEEAFRFAAITDASTETLIEFEAIYRKAISN